jgi:uncharacterized membrane protein YkoI
MSLNKWLAAILSGIALIAALGFGARADEHDEAYELRRAGDILPLEVIVDKAKAIQPGKLLEVELENEHGQPVYEIELYGADGKYHELKLDAKTGKLLKRKREQE